MHTTRKDEGYDVAVPNKTIYVSDGDLKLFQRAQEVAGGNLSAAIASALRRYVDVHEGLREGFDDVVVRVGIGGGRKVRFTGALVGEWIDVARGCGPLPRLARPNRQVRRPHGAQSRLLDGRRRGQTGPGWRGHLGIGDVRYGSSPQELTLEVVATLDELLGKVPPELFDMVARAARLADRGRARHLHRAARRGFREVHDDNSPTTTPAIEVRGLRKSFGKQLVLDDIDLEVPAATVFALLARTGPARRPLSTSSRP